MKKLSVFLILAIAAFAFVGCSDDGTSLAWENTSDTVSDIQWMTGGSSPNQTWDGDLLSGDRTDYKEITQLTGTGDCLDNSGQAATIIIDIDSSSGVKFSSAAGTTIEKDVDALLIIKSAK